MDRYTLYRNGRILNRGFKPREAVSIANNAEKETPPKKSPKKDMLDPVVKAAVETLHFWDGIRRIDMVLAYKDPEVENEHYEDTKSVDVDTLNDEESPDEKEEKRKHEREIFEKNLVEAGLELELEPSQRSGDKRTNFLKISAPWKLLTKYAEVLKLKMPIKTGDEDKDPEQEDSGGCFDSVPKMFDYDHTLIPEEPNFFTAGYINSKQDKFIVKDRDSFFTSAQRSLIVWQVLMRTRYSDSKEDASKVGIARLLSKGTYSAAYPLHDGRYDKDGPNGEQCARRILYLEWGRWQKIFTNQPLWMIKRYFGDKIGLYFAWLGFYTKSLIFPSIIGIITVFRFWYNEHL